jgi:kinesin family protein 2/24
MGNVVDQVFKTVTDTDQASVPDNQERLDVLRMMEDQEEMLERKIDIAIAAIQDRLEATLTSFLSEFIQIVKAKVDGLQVANAVNGYDDVSNSVGVTQSELYRQLQLHQKLRHQKEQQTEFQHFNAEQWRESTEDQLEGQEEVMGRLHQKHQMEQEVQQQPQSTMISARGGSGRLRTCNVINKTEVENKKLERQQQGKAKLKEGKEVEKNSNWKFLSMINQYRESYAFHTLQESDPVKSRPITVCVRKRPLNKLELEREEMDVISVPSKDEVLLHENKMKVDGTEFCENQNFKFDYAFDETCSNEFVYKYTAKPLVQSVFEGGMATCFAYGQTGSGKTHTMGGGTAEGCKKGIYAMTAEDIFKFLEAPEYKDLNLSISASFFEIYCGDIFDLLADRNKLRILEDGRKQVHLVGLTENIVNSVDELHLLIERGSAVRSSASTLGNSTSSRSHAVFQITVRNDSLKRIHGKLSLIDLAGNEKAGLTSYMDKQTDIEGAEINKSLLALKECIRALGRKCKHIPFRDSKLTRILRDSFIGKSSKTCMIAMINPGRISSHCSLNTLRFADRIKEKQKKIDEVLQEQLTQ